MDNFINLHMNDKVYLKTNLISDLKNLFLKMMYSLKYPTFKIHLLNKNKNKSIIMLYENRFMVVINDGCKVFTIILVFPGQKKSPNYL